MMMCGPFRQLSLSLSEGPRDVENRRVIGLGCSLSFKAKFSPQSITAFTSLFYSSALPNGTLDPDEAAGFCF